MKTININVSSKNYNIYIGKGILKYAGEIINNLAFKGKILIITDDNVAPLYLETVKNSIKNYDIQVFEVILPNGEEHTFEGKCDGYIIDEERGTNGFGYDPMFYVPQIDMTFGEAPDDVKHKMSHRYFALLKLSEFIKGLD